MKSLFLIVALLLSITSYAQRNSIGLFQRAVDVGKPALAGSSRYDKASKQYILKGAGYNIWFNRDEFHYLYKKINGDFILTGNFEFMGKGTEAHRKIGWMVRYSLDDDAAHASAVVHGDGLTVLQWRELRGMNMRDPQDEIFFPGKNVQMIQVERKGNRIIMRVANASGSFQTVGEHVMMAMPGEVYAGLFICSHNPEVLEEARVWDVHIDKNNAGNSVNVR